MKIPRRRFGSTPVSLSTICYGTMRLVPERFSEDEILALVLEALDVGITSFHVSHEYGSYPAVCAAFKRARAARPGVTMEIIAKLAVPHFDETELQPVRLRTLVETALGDLGVERIDVVQWLVRQTPNTDDLRLAVLDRTVDEFVRVWRAMQAEGKAVALGVFPYSDAFLQRSLSLAAVDGVVSYFNVNERELDPYLDGLARTGRGIIGIRPLGGGTIRDASHVNDALVFALHHPAIASTILGLSSSSQIAAAVGATTISA